jgi:cation:H+ antiporter
MQQRQPATFALTLTAILLIVTSSRELYIKRRLLHKPLLHSRSLIMHMGHIGIALLVFGSDLMVNNAVEIAASLGMSTLLISLTIVAIGTSLPEIATSVVAAYRGEGDIAVGNIVGSNLFNILLVLGLSAILSPAGIQLDQQAFYFDIPVMFAITILCFPFFISHENISKIEGAFFLSFYIIYTIALVGVSTKASWLTFIYIPLIPILLLLIAYIIKSFQKQD